MTHFLHCGIDNDLVTIVDASEIAQAKLKGLDQTAPIASPKPPKDVNTFKNNQVKYAGGATSIPPDQMKCNILKAKREEEMKNAAAGKCGQHKFIIALYKRRVSR